MGDKSIQYWLRCILLILASIGLTIALPVVIPLVIAIILTLLLWPWVNMTQQYIRKYWKQCPRWLAIIPYVLDQFVEVVKGLQGIDGESIIPHQFEGVINSTLVTIGNYGVDLAQRGVLAIVSFASTLLQLLLVPILTFYLLKDGRSIKRAILNIFSSPTSFGRRSE